MKKTETNRTAQRGGNRERGFSMIELCVVLGIILIVLAMAIFQLGPSLQSARANTAMRQVVEQLRSARELAITNRRWVRVTFPVVVVAGKTEYQVQATIMNTLTTGAGADQVLRGVPIQQPMTFLLPGAPDTPDNFGNAGAITFGGASGGPVGGMMFDANGQLVNGITKLPINGTVFLGTAGHAESVRAVSIMGTTGRIRGWSWNGTIWSQF